jgi:hypothetical protein
MKAKKPYKLIIAAIATTTLLFFGCRDLRTINKDFQGKEISFDLPMIPVSGDFDFSQRTPLNLKDQIEAIHIPLVTLKGFAVREVVIELKDSIAGEPITFDALDNLYLYIAGDSLPEVLIASKDPVPHTNSTILNMDTNSGVNLLPYAKVPFVTYRVKGKSNRATEKAVKMSIKIKWRVTAEIL